MSNQQYRGALTPDHRADWLKARPPAPVWTENLSCPSSGNFRLLQCYAGAGPRYVYRKAKAGELSFSNGRRVETLTGAAYVDQDTISVGGSNVTAVGNATHLGLPCNYITWPAATHTEGSSYCGDNHGVEVAAGQVTGARLDVALSRALVGDETLILRVTGPSTSSIATLTSNFPGPGKFLSVLLGGFYAHSAAGTATLYFHVTGTFSSPLTIYIRRRMLFDASGLDASECVPDFVDPAVDYGFGALGVKWVATKCGNTVGANGVIIPGEGAALPEPMGVQWQPAATGLLANSPPTASGAELTNAAAAQNVAGLPARRITATAVDTYHYYTGQPIGVVNGTYVVQVICRKPASGDGRPRINIVGGGGPTIHPLADWTGVNAYNAPQSRLVSLGDDCYLMELIASAVTDDGSLTVEFILNKGDSSSYADAAVFLDVAVFNVVAQAFTGTPLLASGGATARLADDPATGLPAIGTGPFTAFVHVTRIADTPAGTYPVLFTLTDGSLLCCVYLYTSGEVYCIHPNGDIGSVAISNGVPFKVAYRRSSTNVAMFVNGVKIAERAETPVNFANSPLFGSIYDAFKGDAVIHDQWLEYSALSDEDCTRVTRL